MKAAFAVLAALLLLGAARADTEVGPTFTELEEIPDSEFVFMPAASSSNSIYGTNTRRSSREWPALAVRSLASAAAAAPHRPRPRRAAPCGPPAAPPLTPALLAISLSPRRRAGARPRPDLL